MLVLHSNYQGEDLSAAFAELFQSRASPELRHAIAEGQAAMHYVILHDASSADAAAAKERYVAMHYYVEAKKVIHNRWPCDLVHKPCFAGLRHHLGCCHLLLAFQGTC